MSISLNEIIKKLSQKHEILVGFPKDKQVIYPPDDRKDHHNKGGQTVAQVATANEFGTKTKKGSTHIPSRPFLRTAFKKNRQLIIKLVEESFLLKNIIDNTRFDKIGLKMVDMVRDSIRNGNWIPNAKTTKLSKLKFNTRKIVEKTDEKSKQKVNLELGKIKPLIDRGIMIKSVNYEIRSS